MRRTVDLALGVILLPLFLVGIAVFSIAIILFDHYSPFFFRQKRVGKNGKIFRCFKLQALRPPKSEDEINNKEYDKKRETMLGNFLRNHGLDELPQIFNILIGEMSFIGPRPYLPKNLKQIEDLNPEALPKVKAWEQKRILVRPGLSGWHQIHTLGPQVIKYDLEYLEDPSAKKQLQIFLISIWILIIGKKRYFKSY